VVRRRRDRRDGRRMRWTVGGLSADADDPRGPGQCRPSYHPGWQRVCRRQVVGFPEFPPRNPCNRWSRQDKLLFWRDRHL